MLIKNFYRKVSFERHTTVERDSVLNGYCCYYASHCSLLDSTPVSLRKNTK